MTDELSIVVVSFNSRAVLPACLAALGPDLRARTVVVDNGSGDGTPQIVRRNFPTVRLIETERNLGFGGGCNVGLSASNSEFALVLNPDVEISPEAVSALIIHGRSHPEAGIIAPKLENPDGTRQFSCRTAQSIAHVVLRRSPLGDLPLLARHLQKHLMTTLPAGNFVASDWVLGACMLLRRSDLLAIGGFDDEFFLYCEDLDICLRFWQNQREVHYLPHIVAKHEYQRASRGLNISKLSTRHHIRSFAYYARKHPLPAFGFLPDYLPSSRRRP